MDKVLGVSGAGVGPEEIGAYAEALFGVAVEASIVGGRAVVHPRPRELTEDELAKLDAVIAAKVAGKQPEIELAVEQLEAVDAVAKRPRPKTLEERVAELEAKAAVGEKVP